MHYENTTPWYINNFCFHCNGYSEGVAIEYFLHKNGNHYSFVFSLLLKNVFGAKTLDKCISLKYINKNQEEKFNNKIKKKILNNNKQKTFIESSNCKFQVENMSIQEKYSISE